MNIAQHYIDSVLSGKTVVSEWVRRAVERHINDLDNAEERGMYFDEAAALRAIQAARLVPHAKGRWQGKPFDVQGWQAFILYCVYGWKWLETDTRRFNKVYIKVARKNGKTEFLAAIGVIGMTIDKIPGGEQYWAATKYAQAAIGWERQKTMIELLKSKAPRVFKDFRTNTMRVYHNKNKMFARALGRDSKSEDGLSPYYAFIDEYHAHPDSSQVDILESGMGAYLEPLTWIITTAGFNTSCACKEFEDNCKSILKGLSANEEIFAMIFDLDENDDWEDVEVWAKANPSLGVSNTLKALKSEYEKAKLEGPSKEVSFKVKNLNMWHNARETWINHRDWEATRVELTDEQLAGRPCWGGLDLASTRDVTALVLVWDMDSYLYARAWMWVPDAMVKFRARDASANYAAWAAAGHLLTTPGNVTDYDYLRATINDLRERYNVQGIAYDRFNASQLVIQLSNEGAQMHPFGQGYVSMSPPIKALERRIFSNQFKHHANPALDWMMSNVSLATDAADNHKLVKGHALNKIDGVVALVMAMGYYDLDQKDDGKVLPSDFSIYFG